MNSTKRRESILCPTGAARIGPAMREVPPPHKMSV
jgi:hypothetical protein